MKKSNCPPSQSVSFRSPAPSVLQMRIAELLDEMVGLLANCDDPRLAASTVSDALSKGVVADEFAANEFLSRATM